ncbi:hypothetical protein AC231_19070 [Clostridium pasteurianum]|uniref:YkvA family protein n=1 Tax=Clostridium pasteurianum TaxID=1501 RepID=UPI000975ED09|nr:YkvA family protein [Clostridium pasteurianum]OMH19634.1 hypothetical protein AC231_19070 [Clostridium pasteurianum]
MENKKDITALYLAYKRPDVPFYAKLISILALVYTLSPIDLIADFIPIAGYIDDIIIFPLGIALSIKLIPEKIMNECKQQSENIFKAGRLKRWIVRAIAVVIFIIIISWILT